MTNKITTAANDVAKEFHAKVFVYCGSIDLYGYGALVSAMQPRNNDLNLPNSILILTTNGGSAHFAYQIARLLQKSSEKFFLCIPASCKSAGTLVALGAHKIFMSDMADLGPLDVQLFEKDEIGQRRSGLVVRTALEGLSDETYKIFQDIMLRIKISSQQTISFEVAARIASEIATGVMAPVYQQINPSALGNDLRDLRIATEYGNRLAEYCRNSREGAVERLVEGYPTHEFIIDRDEAKDLFNYIDNIEGSLRKLEESFGPKIYHAHTPHIIRRLDELDEEEASGDDGTKERRDETENSVVDVERKGARRGDSRSSARENKNKSRERRKGGKESLKKN